MAIPTKKPYTLLTINVIEIADISMMAISNLVSFPDNETGINDAELLFKKLIATQTETISDEDIANHLEDGHFQEGDYYVCIVHNNPYPEFNNAGVKPTLPTPVLGQKVRAKILIDRTLDFTVSAGFTGTVIADGNTKGYSGIWVKFDQYINGAEEWSNEVNWLKDHDPEHTLLEQFWSEMEIIP